MTLPLSYSRSFNSKIEAQNSKLRNGFRTSIIDFETGGQGRIRTPVARKERQIYSLLPLPTRPPVRIQISKSQRANAGPLLPSIVFSFTLCQKSIACTWPVDRRRPEHL